MSAALIGFAKSFVAGRLTADQFADVFMELWKIERDTSVLINDDEHTSSILSSVFCLADLYNNDTGREEYEMDELQLRTEVARLVDTL